MIISDIFTYDIYPETREIVYQKNSEIIFLIPQQKGYASYLLGLSENEKLYL